MMTVQNLPAGGLALCNRYQPPHVEHAWVSSEQGNVYKLQAGDTFIGRSDANNIVVSGNRSVSRQHAVIRCTDGVFMIKDLCSSNGTVVNQEQLKGCQLLSDGDWFLIGTAQFRFWTRGADRFRVRRHALIGVTP